MYIDEYILIPNLGANHKAGAPAKSVNEFYLTALSDLSSLSRVSDAPQKQLRILDRDRWSFNLLVLAVDNKDRRLPGLQSQPVRSVGVNKMK
jgi:hypothetical protein